MTADEAQTTPALTEVMLAMDVVDTLRHEERLVAKALDTEARERELVERVRAAYAAQGITVSDAMIATGVAALRKREYEYERPQPGIMTSLLRAWVNRGQIFGGFAAVAGLIGVIWAGWWGFVERPAQQAEQAAMVAEAAEASRRAELPATLARLTDVARDLVATERASDRVEALIGRASTALDVADFPTAQTAVADLERAVAVLGTTYEVTIVSRPGVLTGVIRTPEDRNDVDNYYLVVEARDGANRVVSVPIRSEEDGSVKSVRYWGVRVSEAQFNRVRDDKADDGIVQNNAAGHKPLGALEIDYDIDATGGLIHTWESLR